MLTRVSIYPSYPFQCGFYFISVVVENLSASLQVVSEIVILYVVAVLVSMRGGELRIFLLCHLELEARDLALEGQFSSLSMKTYLFPVVGVLPVQEPCLWTILPCQIFLYA